MNTAFGNDFSSTSWDPQCTTHNSRDRINWWWLLSLRNRLRSSQKHLQYVLHTRQVWNGLKRRLQHPWKSATIIHNGFFVLSPPWKFSGACFCSHIEMFTPGKHCSFSNNCQQYRKGIRWFSAGKLCLWKWHSAQIITGRVDSCQFRSVQDTTRACHGWSRSLTSIWQTKAQLSINSRSIYQILLRQSYTYTCTPSEMSWSIRQECEPSLWKAYTNRTESTEGTTWHRGIVKIDGNSRL